MLETFNLQYAAVTKDVAQRSPSILHRAVSPSTLLRTVSLSNGLSNGNWTFYEVIMFESKHGKMEDIDERECWENPEGKSLR